MIAMSQKKIRDNRSSRKMSVASPKAIDMFRGSNGSARTYYDCSVIERAKENKVLIRIFKNERFIFRIPRQIHRSSLTGVYGDIHESAGVGKYIDQEAIEYSSNGKTIINGAQHVNPFLTVDRIYNTIITVFKNTSDQKQLEKMSAVVNFNKTDGEHLVWNGPRKHDDAVYVSPWLNREQIWEMAMGINSTIASRLRNSKSQRTDVKAHFSTKEKFFTSLDVLRRARKIFSVGTGETEYSGGATPYSMPLEQAGFAIDMFFLTNSIDEHGNEIGEYHYRMAFGRPNPWVLYKRHWKHLGVSDKHAYLNKNVLEIANQQ